MNVFIDTEFTDFDGALISMALVDTHGREFYRELHDVNWARAHPWVWANVIPKLTGPSIQVSMRGLTRDLKAWLFYYDEINLIADWPDDFKYFCQALITGPGQMIHVPRLTMTLERDLTPESANPHHALADARALRDAYARAETNLCV